MVNMERCRWLPSTKKSTNIIVNIPDYKLQVMKGDSTLFSMAAIVGKEANKTVIFMGNINEIIFNPYWNIPKSITEKEILPLIKKDPGYLEHNNMEWFGGQLRQKPGPNNALGKIKFIFPNPFNIYLHDTPAKHLFQLEKRNFSHGCIRIGEPLKLTTFLLSYEKDWNEKRILDELSQKKEKTVRLSDPIPVYIIYLTSFVDSKGRLNFREDLYKRDNYLKEMLLWVK
jgi:murein L,D-transpeptidase YcbB/YkuD